jgi:hypothetical protein
MNGAAVRKASEEGVARMEQALAVVRLIAWRWPLPQRTPQNPTMISAADVVSSKLWVESPFAKIQEANEKPNKSHCQKSVGISEKPSQATDQACERKCSRPNFANSRSSPTKAPVPNASAKRTNVGRKGQCETVFVMSGTDI